MSTDGSSNPDGSILQSLGISADEVVPPADVWDRALTAAFDETLPSDDATVPVQYDEPVVPFDEDMIVVDDHADVVAAHTDTADQIAIDHDTPAHGAPDHEIDPASYDAPGEDFSHDITPHDDFGDSHSFDDHGRDSL